MFESQATGFVGVLVSVHHKLLAITMLRSTLILHRFYVFLSSRLFQVFKPFWLQQQKVVLAEQMMS